MKNRGGYRRREGVSPGMVDLAGRRIDFLFDVMRSQPETPLRAVLSSAYLQGIEDVAQAIDGTSPVALEAIGERPLT